jgi:hypothetical protein
MVANGPLPLGTVSALQVDPASVVPTIIPMSAPLPAMGVVPTARQSVLEVHATAASGPAPPGKVCAAQWAPPSVLDNTMPSVSVVSLPTAQQSEEETHVTPERGPASLGRVSLLQVAPASVVARAIPVPGPKKTPGPLFPKTPVLPVLPVLPVPLLPVLPVPLLPVPLLPVVPVPPTNPGKFAPTVRHLELDTHVIESSGPVPAGRPWVAHVCPPSVVESTAPLLKL